VAARAETNSPHAPTSTPITTPADSAAPTTGGRWLSFVLATSVFSLVFVSQKLADQIPVGRYILTLAGLFSLFCYMQELQRLGNTMMGREK
jgi:hypothetical protein